MNVGFGQILLILIVCFLLFGGRHLPQLFRNLADGIRTFRGALDSEKLPSLEDEGENQRKVTKRYKKGN